MSNNDFWDWCDLNLLGKTIEDAQRALSTRTDRTDWIIRVVEVNGRKIIYTQDFKVNRINVWLKNGKINEVRCIG